MSYLKERCENLILSIRSRYEEQFRESLSFGSFAQVISEEIKKRQMEFIRMQFVAEGLSFSELIMLAKLIAEKNDELPTLFPESLLLEDQNKFKLTVSRKGRKPVLTDEEKQERRRIYARTYYKRKKLKNLHDNEENSLFSKSYKTTDEQRAYQRAYYKRKKEEKALNSSKSSVKESEIKSDIPVERTSRKDSILAVRPFRTKLRKNQASIQASGSKN